MPLRIRLRDGEKIVVNGAVMKNDTGRMVELLALNRINFLREREIVLPEDAVTPLLKVIYWLQIAYIDPEGRDVATARFIELGRELFEATTNNPIRTAVAAAIAAATEGQYAAGLKALRDVLPVERQLLGLPEPSAASGRMAKALRRDKPTGSLDVTVVEDRSEGGQAA